MENQNYIEMLTQLQQQQKTVEIQESFDWLCKNCDIQVLLLEEYDIIQKDYKKKELFITNYDMDKCSFKIVDTNQDIDDEFNHDTTIKIEYTHLYMVNKPCIFVKGTFRGEEITINMLNKMYVGSRAGMGLNDNLVHHIRILYGVPPVVFHNKFENYSFFVSGEERVKYEKKYLYNLQRQEDVKIYSKKPKYTQATLNG